MNESGAFHPIACESCRNKKLKCDRELPVCSQCVSAENSCRYPPTNKRGIPSGYISFIEQRLLETEMVVLELLSAIYNSQVPIETQRLSDTDRRVLAGHVQKQAKSSRIEEWKSLPLNTGQERLSWWLKRQDLITKGAEANTGHASQASPAQTEPWGMESSPAVIQYEDLQLSAAEKSSLLSSLHPQLAHVTWQPVPDVPGVLKPTSALQDQDQDMLNAALVGNLLSKGYHDESSERPAPSASHTALEARPSTTEQWRKYF